MSHHRDIHVRMVLVLRIPILLLTAAETEHQMSRTTIGSSSLPARMSHPILDGHPALPTIWRWLSIQFRSVRTMRIQNLLRGIGQSQRAALSLGVMDILS